MTVESSSSLYDGRRCAVAGLEAGGKNLGFERAVERKRKMITRIQAPSYKAPQRSGNHEGQKGKILAEKGGLDVALDPEGVLGI